MRYAIIVLMATWILVGVTACINGSGKLLSAELALAITSPISMTGGEVATWRAEWSGGTAPYEITWDFGGGAENIGPMAALSPDSRQIAMINEGTAVAQYTYTVTVTDGTGGQAPASSPYLVAPRPNAPPVIESLEWDDMLHILTVEVSDPDGEPLTLTAQTEGGISLDKSEVFFDSGSGTAAVHVSADDIFSGGSGTITITADDGRGVPVTQSLEVEIVINWITPDTLYAIPLADAAAVDEPVTIVVATADISSFQFMAGVAVTVEEDSQLDPSSFNPGEPGGGPSYADGAWVGMEFEGFLMSPDWLQTPRDIGNGREAWDFNLTPYGGHDVSGFNGALFNFRLLFSEPGVKHLGLQQVDGVNRTYYMDGTGTEYFWDTLMADEMGDLNTVGINNTILVE